MVRKQVRKGELLVLSGITVAVKNNICIEGSKTTCSYKILEDFVSPYT
ncbi:MAG: hypothetical protein LBC85_01560, partial [Fibromonadaceae bacterium]|nr:hypothetical protein [Fibromonadaceae bacterium]